MNIDQQINIIKNQININNKKKLLFIVPESAGDIFLATSLLKSLRNTYYEYEIYFACKEQYKDILVNNPYITKCIDYYPVMDNQIYMEGTAEWKGLFDISILATVLTQRVINYLNNGQTRLAINLKE